MIQKFLPAACEAGRIVAADQSDERFLPLNGKPLQLLQKLSIQ